MHDQWYHASEQIPEGFYIIEALHSNKFITCSSERSTLVQQDRNVEDEGESQVFEIQHIGYRDYIIRHRLSGLVLTVHNGSPSPCAPIILSRYMGPRTPHQIVNFERANDQTSDLFIFIKHTRMVIDVDGGSQNSNARLLQFPLKKTNANQINQRFRLRPADDTLTQQKSIIIPAEYFR